MIRINNVLLGTSGLNSVQFENTSFSSVIIYIFNLTLVFKIYRYAINKRYNMSLQRSLRKLIDQTFTVSERREIGSDLNINYDEVPSRQQSQKIIGFLVSAYQNEKLEELHEILTQERPEVTWPPLEEIRAVDWPTAAQIIMPSGD
jgi:hypothetical protein